MEVVVVVVVIRHQRLNDVYDVRDELETVLVEVEDVEVKRHKREDVV